MACLHKAVDGHEPLAIKDAQKAVALQAARKAVTELGAACVLAIPLSDGEDIVGMLVLVHSRRERWQQADMVVLKTVADQMVIALNNAGLRRLVKNLSVTDEKSGLLKRASYIDLLLAESKRAMQNSSALSVLLLQFGKSGAMIKEYGEADVQAMMEKAGQLIRRQHPHQRSGISLRHDDHRDSAGRDGGKGSDAGSGETAQDYLRSAASGQG